MNGVRILRMPAVFERAGCPRASWYAGAKRGLWTPPVKLGLRASGVPEHEIDAVLQARIAGKSEDEIRSLVAELIAARGQRAAA